MAPSLPKTYPFPCTQCRARYFCHCSTLQAAGWCLSCKALECPCPKMKCDRCIVECLCDVFEPICMECIALESAKISCEKCESPYECVCELLIENGNCPTCMKLICMCNKIDTVKQ